MKREFDLLSLCDVSVFLYTLYISASKTAEKGKKADKPMYLRDYERKQLLERGAMAGVSDSEEEEEQKKVSNQ